MVEETDEIPSEQMLLALLQPVARLMIHEDIGLPKAVEILKSALVTEVYAQEPQASVSHVSLRTGVHRKDVKRLELGDQVPRKASAAARVLTLWQVEPDYVEAGRPKALVRQGSTGFDSLVSLAKVDAAPATVLSVLLASGNVTEKDGLISFVIASVVPHDGEEKTKAAIATLVPHLDTTIGNLTSKSQHFDQALRYSHLSQQAADELEKDAARMAMEMLQTLNKKAISLQQSEEGDTLFVAGAYVNKKAKNQ
ncbi:MAG: DUF6502 family protein [Pseudomonadota bacterium]